MTVSWSIETPAHAPGAIAIIALHGLPDELDAAIERCGLEPVAAGRVLLRDMFGIDRGIIIRWSPSLVHLMPHGGTTIVRSIARRLCDHGILERALTPEVAYPEASSVIESRMLETLSRAASPLAIDLLLEQPGLWSAGAAPDAERDRILKRLIDPPLVAAMGPANIGKSSLINTLAGRSISIVADEPGTTRDHVGVLINLGGLIVRYLDTPGFRSTDDPIEREAQRLARRAAEAADLLLVMGDANSPPLPPPNGIAQIVIALRSDLGLPAWHCDVAVSARTGHGIPELVRAIREALVPAAVLQSRIPWRFWADRPVGAGN